MKHRLTKGILAAVLAFTTIQSIPLITANAACSHNYRHYAYDSTSWTRVYGPDGYVTKWENGRKIHYIKYQKTVYTCCVNCGGDEGSYVVTTLRCIE